MHNNKKGKTVVMIAIGKVKGDSKMMKEYGGKEKYKSKKAKMMHEKKESKKTEMMEKKKYSSKKKK